MSSQNSLKSIVYVPHYGSKGLKSDWERELLAICKTKNIRLEVVNKTNLIQTDRVVFFDNLFYHNLPQMWKLYENKLLHGAVYLDYEPPSGHCQHHTRNGLLRLGKIFGKIITYNDDLIDGKKFIKGCVGDFYNQPKTEHVDFSTKKLLCMVTNNLTHQQIISFRNLTNATTYFNEQNTCYHPDAIYHRRLEAARYFAHQCPQDFDLFGSDWPKDLKIVNKGSLKREEKLITMTNYRFAISYDSIINQRGYISEKIFDCFLAKVIPVHWGADNVDQYIPQDCFIDKRKFATYDQLYKYLLEMSEQEYERRIAAIEKYLKSPQYLKLFSSEASANIIFKALEEEVAGFSYPEAHQELLKLQQEKDEVDKKSVIKFAPMHTIPWLSLIKHNSPLLKQILNYRLRDHQKILFIVKKTYYGFRKIYRWIKK